MQDKLLHRRDVETRHGLGPHFHLSLDARGEFPGAGEGRAEGRSLAGVRNRGVDCRPSARQRRSSLKSETPPKCGGVLSTRPILRRPGHWHQFELGRIVNATPTFTIEKPPGATSNASAADL